MTLEQKREAEPVGAGRWTGNATGAAVVFKRWLPLPAHVCRPILLPFFRRRLPEGDADG